LGILQTKRDRRTGYVGYIEPGLEQGQPAETVGLPFGRRQDEVVPRPGAGHVQQTPGLGLSKTELPVSDQAVEHGFSLVFPEIQSYTQLRIEEERLYSSFGEEQEKLMRDYYLGTVGMVTFGSQEIQPVPWLVKDNDVEKLNLFKAVAR
jgi:hypothetical protein